MDISAAIIHKILIEQNLEAYSKLKLVFLDSAYSTLYSVISKHYEKHNTLPSFDDLEITLRDSHVSKTLAAVKLLDLPDVSADIILDALIDRYTQNETIKLLDPFLDKLALYDTSEIKENLSSMALVLEEKTHTSETVHTMYDLDTFQPADEILRERIYLGLNTEFDAAIGGMARQELLLLGGRRGAGKSLVSSNLFTHQYELGYSSLYFTIEMTAFEIHQRHMSILTGVPLKNIKSQQLDTGEIMKLASCRANMFTDGEEALEKFRSHNDRFKFQEDLNRNYTLKPDNQMMIIDDRSLTLGSIDLHIGKTKAKFGDKLGLVIVDYLNQIAIEGPQFGWQEQIDIAKKLKNLARKHEVVIVSPYQMDASGEARFSKGILDSADISLILNAHPEAISFESTKMRGAAPVEFTCPMKWDIVTVLPQSIDKPGKKEKEEKKEKKEKKEEKASKYKTEENTEDLPWDD